MLALVACLLVSAEPVRVTAARQNKQTRVRELFSAAHVAYPAPQIFLRAFKREGELEVWAGEKKGELSRVVVYPICAASGVLGPKRRLGDEQVPEGFYQLNRWNPTSNFHLSLGLDYPNASDRILGYKPALGGDIFIHGSCVTIGCIPIEDGPIEELYLMTADARAGGATVPVHVFPRRLDETGMSALEQEFAAQPELIRFWRSLVPGYRAFEEHHRVPRVRVDRVGAYAIVE